MDRTLKRLGFKKADLEHMDRLAQLSPEQFEQFVTDHLAATSKAGRLIERRLSKKTAAT